MTSTSYPSDARDWRGVFISHMAGSLARRDDLRLRLWAPPGALPQHVEAATTPAEAQWLGRLMEEGGVSHLLRQRPWSGLGASVRLLRWLGRVFRRFPGTDLYHVNWLQCALPLPHDGKPALITILGNDMQLLRLPLVRAALARAMRNRPVALCPNADWMEAPLRAAFGRAMVVTVPFGIDERWYAVKRGTPTAAVPLWLVVTRLTAAKLGPLFEWSRPLFAGRQRHLHVFGPMQESIQVPDWVQYHGPIDGDSLAGEWFPRASGLITLSQHAEGRPQVMLEAMAAGLPIIASRMPAHADIVQDGSTGRLCGTAQEYAQALDQVEDVSLNRSMGDAARAWVMRTLGTWDDCAQRYVDVYKVLCKDAVS
ncbi:glycosyltransferase [Frateuria edaphi]|uniref:glycosyltransferase family 4 protein n=1 Tax=Frateuria edaphi TaxID=2898793 RepID=UPI001E5B3272|nr:glycosyltransferase [Frateuria edaphi]UGB46554.1 glycosyltransferase [Frateuria edaphi]